MDEDPRKERRERNASPRRKRKDRILMKGGNYVFLPKCGLQVTHELGGLNVEVQNIVRSQAHKSKKGLANRKRKGSGLGP